MKKTLIALLAVITLSAHAEAPKSAEGIEASLREQLGKLERGPDAQEKADTLFKAAITEIDDYLQANPEAKDKLSAQTLQVQLYNASGQDAKAGPMLVELYKQVPRGKEGDLKNAIPLVALQTHSLLAKGEKKAATALLDGFEKDFAEHPDMGREASQMLQSMRGQLSLPSVGDTMEIAFTALDGTKVDLAAMKGKVVLVDFWATWCGPCVGELPNVKAAFAAYHDKGFEIIAISLDEDKEVLQNFVTKEKMTWPQAFDGKGWQSELATKYGIHSIPATFLIGKDGKIAASNLRGPILEAKLAELLK